MGDTKHVRSNTKRESLPMTAALEMRGHPSPAVVKARNCLEDMARKRLGGSYDTWTAARDRVADEIGVTQTYAQTIWQRWKSMKSIDGDALLAIINGYEKICLSVEAAADHQEFLRGQIENGETSNERRSAPDLELASQDRRSTEENVGPVVAGHPPHA